MESNWLPDLSCLYCHVLSGLSCHVCWPSGVVFTCIWCFFEEETKWCCERGMLNSWDWITMSPWLMCFSIICLIFLLLCELLIMAILCCNASRERPKSHVSKNKDLPRPDEAFEKDSLNKGNILKGEFGEPLPSRYAPSAF